MQFQGAASFRHRIVLSVLSGKSVLIKDIRKDDEEPGLKSFEASFLRLVEQMSDGCSIEINETGTVIKFRPGIVMGGNITHDCGTSRAIGWFVEGIIPMAIFAKAPLSLNMTGITNDDTDLSVDILRNVTFPLLKNFNLTGLSLEIKKRGAHPNGGGSVHLFVPIAREIQPINITDMGLIKRVRGVGYCSKISPSILARLVDTTRNVLNQYLPDVYINTDHYKGKDSGLSAGYSLALFAGEL
jgi:RNA 3'-terminal phosphate cyclase-like protein